MACILRKATTPVATQPDQTLEAACGGKTLPILAASSSATRDDPAQIPEVALADQRSSRETRRLLNT